MQQQQQQQQQQHKLEREGFEKSSIAISLEFTIMPTFEVHLAVYDLSRGMARNLSAQFLGAQHTIDAIPHTGIVVYGQEYFFGSGIQREDPQLFRQASGLIPIQVLGLGRTRVTQAEFEAWCSRQTKYTSTTYDLLQRNCNHFSHDAALEGLRLPQGVPGWILQVPQQFLSSPLGQMVRPMLQNMQLTAVDGAQPVLFNNTTTPTTDTNEISAASSSSHNPWANIPSPEMRPPNSEEKNPASTDAGEKQKIATPVLDQYTKPLLSNDTKSVSLCIRKLSENASGAMVDKPLVWEQLEEHLTTANARQQSWTGELSQQSCQALFLILEKEEPSRLHALLLLRLVVLKVDRHEPSLQTCLDWITTHILKPPQEGSSASAALQSVAWTCLANAMGRQEQKQDKETNQDWGFSEKNTELLLDMATAIVTDASRAAPPVRQAASAWLYNATFSQSDNRFNPNSADQELTDFQVAVLCGTLQDIEQESDKVVRLRRLLTAGRILRPFKTTDTIHTLNAPAVNLVKDLGLSEALQQIQDESLSKELVSLIVSALAG